MYGAGRTKGRMQDEGVWQLVQFPLYFSLVANPDPLCNQTSSTYTYYLTHDVISSLQGMLLLPGLSGLSVTIYGSTVGQVLYVMCGYLIGEYKVPIRKTFESVGSKIRGTYVPAP